MAWTLTKVLIAGILISFTSWLAGKKPVLAGFLLALPVSTLIALAFTHIEHREPEKSVLFAKSVFYAVPLSLSFFIPFLLAEKIKAPFWSLYALGLACLVIAYFVHRLIFSA